MAAEYTPKYTGIVGWIERRFPTPFIEFQKHAAGYYAPKNFNFWYYFGVLSHLSAGHVVVILLASVLGILGSYGVAWFGIRINTVANSRAAFSAEPTAAITSCKAERPCISSIC